MIEVKNISKQFGKLQALKNVSFSCHANECIALTGPNGSGKTTFIKCLLGMVLPDAGNIIFKGTDTAKSWRYKADIGYMPQIARYPDNMTIGYVLDMLKDMGGKNLRRDDDLIKAFNIPGLLHKRMRTLSGGTRQKVSACIAFMFDTDVLILDEPTAGLDPIASEILKSKILAEKEKGKLIIITSHVLSELDDLVSHVMYMQDGELRLHNTVSELRNITGEQKINKAIATLMYKSTYEQNS